MKKSLKIFISVSALATLLLPLLILAQEAAPTKCVIRRDTKITGCPGVGSEAVYDRQYGKVRGAVCCLMSTIYYFTDWAFAILLALAVVFGIFGGFQIVTAAGSVEQVEKGKGYVKYALIGVVVALAAKAIPAIVKTVMGI